MGGVSRKAVKKVESRAVSGEGRVRSSGWIGRQDQVGGWMGGVSGKVVKNAELADEER